ncbi:T9SS type A sorting domain-containing protein [Chryseobacterium sp. MEBOG06]|uniref:T9SS type A sorting domain-containing protein n=1 Tax=Chryseobacterium sp. MEBOG06 TaxID=2879938 RepID=UPI001F1F5E5B|nr:T9SS type A sorting domain-containing protein [Chryseobacterium sp. MEBOG06]UKB85994.1 T9SS type A sorting domain-containing protein [Chryseobacterium sp. MEBOG06]
MKKLTLSAAMTITGLMFGQITLDKNFVSENLQVYTNADETFYYSVGYGMNEVKIYKADYSIYKQFTPTVPSGYNMFIDQYNNNFILSKSIFNTDSKLEIIITFEKYNPATSEREYIIKIYNEDGNIIHEFGPNYKFSDEYDINIYHDNISNINKLRLFNQNTNSTEIYVLPTTLLSAKEIQSKAKLSAFPNPANKILNIINPGKGSNTIEIYDGAGKIILTQHFNMSDSRISINVENLPVGTYFYQIGVMRSKFIKN